MPSARFKAALAGLLIAGGAGIALACDCPIPDVPIGLNYFTQAMLAQMNPLRSVIRQGLTCPMDNSTNNLTGTAPYAKGFPFFPISVCQTQDMVSAAASTWTDGQIVHFIPEQRYQTPRNRPPFVQGFPHAMLADGSTCFFVFSSYQRAEAASRASIAWSVGAPAHGLDGYLDITEAAGIPDAAVFSSADFNTNVATLCNQTYSTTGPGATTWHVAPEDTVVLPAGRIADVKTAHQDGVMVDYEPLDGRSETACAGCGSASQIKAEAQIAHDYGFHFRLYTNPIEISSSATDNNFSAGNLPGIIGDPNIKRFSIILTPEVYPGSTSNGDPLLEFKAELTAANGGTLPSTTAAGLLSKIFATVQLGPAQGGWTPDQINTIKFNLDKFNIPEVDVFPKNLTSTAGAVCPLPTRYTLQKLANLLGLTISCTPVSGGAPSGSGPQCLEAQDGFDLLADLNDCLLSGD